MRVDVRWVSLPGKVSRAILLLLATIAVVLPGEDQAFAASGTWATKASMPTARCCLGAGVVNGVVYAVGGQPQSSHGSSLATVAAYNPGTNTWTTKASMPTPSQAPGVGVVNGILYAVGGYNNGYLTTVQAYDPSTDSWTAKASMPTARMSLTVAVVNGILYAVGGMNGSRLTTVEAYDPGTDTWTTKASMSTGREGPASGVVNGILYVVGGDTIGYAISTVEAYDPSADKWTAKASMSTPRLAPAAAVVNGILYAVGGLNNNTGGSVLSTVEAYDPGKDTWSTGWTAMPTARYFPGAVVIKGSLYALGGADPSSTFVATNEAFTPPVSFAAVSAKVDINLASSSFSVSSSFTLGSDGSTKPLTDAVTAQFGGFSITIPAGSFHPAGDGKRFIFDGTIGGVAVSANLTPLGGSSYSLKLDIVGASNLPTSNPVTATLTVGNNTGTTSVNATFQ